jgi:hypothetical protein
LRIDDRLDTALRGAAASAGQPSIGVWRQLVDILAQDTGNFAPQTIAAGLVATHRLGRQITVADRKAGVAALSGRLRSPALLQLLAGDAPPVAAEAIRGAQLSDEEWSELVPELPVRARGFLRGRNDLGQKTRRALAAWGGADFRLSADPLATAAPSIQPVPATAPAIDVPAPTDKRPGVSEIGAIVQRIEDWKRSREHGESPRLPLGDEELEKFVTPITEITFETDDAGAIIWVEGAPRGAIVGTDIARPAYDHGPGPDAYGAAAFAQRMPMEHARMTLRGSPSIDGDWRITASPFFDALTGRFRGFRGIMRRPKPHEQAAPTIVDRKRQGESMQQIVHELRTPLGAISGFAEIIEQQLFGPVDDEYRAMAGAILADARKLLGGFDDISTTARLDSGNYEIDPGQTDVAWLADTMRQRLAAISESSGVIVNLIFADPVRPFAIERDFAERIFSRLISAIIVAGVPGEVINGRCKTLLGPQVMNCFSLDLPEKLRSFSEEELLGTGATADDPYSGSDLSPLLGLGFSLRLVRNLACKAGGDLRFQKEQVLLILPAIQNGDRNVKGTGGD